MSGAASGMLKFKFLKPSLRPQPSDFGAAVGWGIAGASGALYLVQPFGWIKRTFFPEQQPEEQK